MIDIHSHIIPCVDDGSTGMEISAEMLKTEKMAGVTDIICTPHFRRGFFETTKEIISSQFEKLKQVALELGINVYLGQEIAVKNIFAQDVANGKCFTMANSPYVLLEFDYNNYVDIYDVCYDYKVCGLIPIIAHVERYEYVDVHMLKEIVSMGGLVQINSSSVTDKKFSRYRKKVDRYLKENLVHFVASDNHCGRKFELDKAYNAVKKKFGDERAEALFESNARKILHSQK